jgi:sensor histidine kinase YesM
MTLKLPRYTSKDYTVLAILIAPITLVINSIIFGSGYYMDWRKFLFATLVTAAVFCINFTICGWVAVQMKKRLPSEKDVSKRLTLMIIVFILLTGLFFFTLFQGYATFPFLKYTYNEPGFIWAYMGMAIINVFITLLMEGVARFESWKQNLVETEQLKKTFRQSQLQGLKSQVNPHFLFNSLNTLSSLIAEDEQKAEQFLNEMTKVYRYMLRSEEEQLVTLDTELKFINSYVYLLKSRFGEGMQTHIEVEETDREKLLPALSLQVLIENAFTKNTVSKLSPLSLEICSCGDNKVSVRYNKQEKTQNLSDGVDKELDNLIKKYALLNQAPVSFSDKENECCCFLPLFNEKEEAAS